jgi:hypothetical protein
MSVITAYEPVVVADLDPEEPVPVEEYIADVLRRAHRTAEAVRGPDEARAVLNVAQMFAEDLAKSNPGFDRVEFIEAITRRPA